MASVFISHSSADRAFVSRLATDLRALGHTVWLDTQQLRVGQVIPREISKGLAGAEFVAVVLSKAATASGWVEEEWYSKFDEEARGSKGTILPVLRQKCELPSFLRSRKFADFTESYARGLAQLSSSLTPSDIPSDSSPSLKRALRDLEKLVAGSHGGKGPELLMAFERTSGAIAAMLAQRMRIPEILVLNRTVRDLPGKRDAPPQAGVGRISIGAGVRLDASVFDRRRMAIVVYHLLTGENLRAGLDFLRSQGLSRLPPVFCLYVSHVARTRWTEIEWVSQNEDVRGTRLLLPWADGEPHIL